MIDELITGIDLKGILIPLIGVWLISMMTTAWKGGFTQVYLLLKRLVSVTIYISNQNWSFYKFLELLEEEKLITNIRHLRFQSGRWGESDEISIGLGVGIHFIKYKGKLLFIGVAEKENKLYDESLGLMITIFGRSNKIVYELRNELYRLKDLHRSEPGKTRVMYYRDNFWSPGILTDERTIDTVFVPSETEKKLFNTIKEFQVNESWYKSKGLNYQLGILLYGPPGSGKTSLIKSVASHFGFTICLLRATELDQIREAMLNLPKKSILIIEDVESNKMIKPREEKSEDHDITISQTTNPLLGSAKTKPATTLSDVLNSLDGLLSVPGRILIMTTNYIDKIDKALLRPGRVDLKLEIGYVTNEMFVKFVTKFYGFEIKAPFTLKDDKITVSQLQNEYITNNLSYDELLIKYTDLEWED